MMQSRHLDVRMWVKVGARVQGWRGAEIGGRRAGAKRGGGREGEGRFGRGEYGGGREERSLSGAYATTELVQCLPFVRFPPPRHIHLCLLYVKGRLGKTFFSNGRCRKTKK